VEALTFGTQGKKITGSFRLLSLQASLEKIKLSNTTFSSQNGGVVGEIEPKLANWHNLTRKGRSRHGDDLYCAIIQPLICHNSPVSKKSRHQICKACRVPSTMLPGKN